MLKYYKELFLYIKDKIPNKDNAQDIVQETYEKIISIKNSKEIENERALLYKVAKNIIIDRLRKNKNYKEISYEEENFISQSKAPEDLAIEQNQQDILMKELKKLPPKRKEAFVLHILEGYTKEETERDLEYDKVVDYMNNNSKNGIIALRYLNSSQIDEFFDFEI